MATYGSYAAAPKNITNESFDVTPYWVDEGILDPGELWLQIVQRTTTQAKCMTLEACRTQRNVIIGLYTTAYADTTSASYSRENDEIDSYTYEQTVVVTGRIPAPIAPES